MFSMKELNPYFDMATMEINGIEYTLTKAEELSGSLAVWVSESNLIYATPCYDGVAVPVQVIDSNEQEIGTDGYQAEIDSYERYSKVVQTLAAKILRRPRM